LAQDATSAAEGATPKRRGRPPGGNGRKVRPISEMRTAEDNQAGRRRRASNTVSEAMGGARVPTSSPYAMDERASAEIPYAQVWLRGMLEIAAILQAAPQDMRECRTFADVVEAQRRMVFACADSWFDGLQDTATQVDRAMRRQAESARRKRSATAA
jgi:hypothetical protein